MITASKELRVLLTTVNNELVITIDGSELGEDIFLSVLNKSAQTVKFEQKRLEFVVKQNG